MCLKLLTINSCSHSCRRHSQRSSPPLVGTVCGRSGRSERSSTMLTAKHIVYGLDCYHTSCWTDKKEHPNPWKTQKRPPATTAACQALSFNAILFPLEFFWTFSASLVQNVAGALTKATLKSSKAARAPGWLCVIGMNKSCRVVLKTFFIYLNIEKINT